MSAEEADVAGKSIGALDLGSVKPASTGFTAPSVARASAAPSSREVEDEHSMDPALVQALTGVRRDREFALMMEQDLLTFMRASKMNQLTFNSLNSRQRLWLHRLAARFNLGHSVMGEDGPTRNMMIHKRIDSTLPALTLLEELAKHEALSMPLTTPVPTPAPQKVMLMKRRAPSDTTGAKPVVSEPAVTVTALDSPGKSVGSSLAGAPSKIKASSRPETPASTPVADSTKPSTKPDSVSSPADVERIVEDKEKAYAAARARIFAGESDGSSEAATAAAELEIAETVREDSKRLRAQENPAEYDRDMVAFASFGGYDYERGGGAYVASGGYSGPSIPINPAYATSLGYPHRDAGPVHYARGPPSYIPVMPPPSLGSYLDPRAGAWEPGLGRHVDPRHHYPAAARYPAPGHRGGARPASAGFSEGDFPALGGRGR